MIALATLAMLAISLAWANTVQPPRLVGAVVNPHAVTDHTGQRLTLEFSQSISGVDPSQVTIEPRVDAVITGGERTIDIEFAELLDYATEYTVTARVQAHTTGVSGVVGHSFVTSNPAVYTLVRGEAADRIMQQRLHADDSLPSTAYEHASIQEYAPFGERLVIVTRDGSGAATPRLVDPMTGEAEGLSTGALPELTHLRVDAQSLYAGFLVRVPATDGKLGPRTLIVQPLAAGIGAPREITVANSREVGVRDWRPLPATGAILVELEDGKRYVVRLTPSLELADPPRLIDPSDVESEIHGEGLRRFAADRARAFFTPASPASRVGEVCAASNGRAAAIEVISHEGRPDGAPHEERFTHTTTVFVRVSDGETIASMPGAMPSWCR